MNIAKYYDNQYFKYVLMFLAATNLITFVIKKKYDTIIFFIAISILTAHYTKSTSIILLISLITSNLFNTLEHQKEGLADKKESDDKESDDKESDDKESDEGTKKEADDEDSDKEGDGEGSNKEVDDEDSDKEDDGEGSKKEVDDEEEDRIKNKDSKNVLGFDKLENSESSTSKSDDGAVGNNINYSATLEDAYKNLQGLLGKDGIKGLTSQTNKLLGQQKNLMDSLKNMGPIIDDAQNTLKGFDLPGITKLFNRKKTDKTDKTEKRINI